MEEEKVYPTPTDAEGYFYENKEEETLDIKTKSYDNGNSIKEVLLSTGELAKVRKLKGRDFVESQKLTQSQGDNQIDFLTANISRATTIDGETRVPEYYLDDLYQNDYSAIFAAYSGLNFQ